MLLELEDANAFVVPLDAQRSCFATTSFSRISCAWSSAERWRIRFLTSTAGLRGGSLITGDVVEAVRHTLAAGDWPDAARLVADHSFRWVLDGQAGTIRTVLEAFPEGASLDHPIWRSLTRQLT